MISRNKTIVFLTYDYEFKKNTSSQNKVNERKDVMKNQKDNVSITDYHYAKEILSLTLIFFKKIECYKKNSSDEVVLSLLEELSTNLLEQFSQLITILEVQDNVSR